MLTGELAGIIFVNQKQIKLFLFSKTGSTRHAKCPPPHPPSSIARLMSDTGR